MHPWQGRILRHGAEPHGVPRSRGLCFCTAAALLAQGLIRPNADWMRKTGRLTCPVCAPRAAPPGHASPHTPPGDPGTGLGTEPPAQDGAFSRRGCLAASGAVEPSRIPRLAASFPRLALGPRDGWAEGAGVSVRGRWEGQGTFGVTDGVAAPSGHHHKPTAQGWLCGDGTEPAPALGSSPLPWAHVGLLEAEENSSSLFLGKAGICGEALEGLWIPRDADVRPEHGRRAVAPKSSPAIQPCQSRIF